MRPIDVANAMKMKPRSYEYFESGKARLNVDRVHQVAKILNADPYAILAAIDIGSPAFALRTVENKMGTLWLMALLEFDATAQDDISRLAPAVLIVSFTKMFDELLVLARERDASAEDWMSDKPLQAPPAESDPEARADDQGSGGPDEDPGSKPSTEGDPDDAT
ncbi:helix-turn-helix domain-containing protein [Phenylobacterium sp.]|uniref:helix-turn-helix domain-containing protein n=1 Tax=Phenylobacterium sp. TaxID=1871053 RepID=UPI0035693AE2